MEEKTKIDKLSSEIKRIDSVLLEKQNLLAVFEKAKNAYVADMKYEILANKSGFMIEE